MKILYAVQATGNGHISRAMELLPHLQQYGEVEIFLSGANSSLDFNFPVKYRSKGISLFFTCNGKLDYIKTALSFSPLRILKEVRDLPIEKYDLILNDFECITALACRLKKIPSVNFGHQASFVSSKTPRPDKKSLLGEWILKNYAPASFYVGLHFQRYDKFILPPIIRNEIQQTEPINKNHITVYLPSYCNSVMEKIFHALPDFIFHLFSGETKQASINRNIHFFPVNKSLFTESFQNCKGLITGGGFETPAEAVYLRKKLMVIPIKGQYEQQCNAAALEQMGIRKLYELNSDFYSQFYRWIESETHPDISFAVSTEAIMEEAMNYILKFIEERKNQVGQEDISAKLLQFPRLLFHQR